MMEKEYRPWNPDQSYLLPPSPRDWLPKNHVAYFILDTVRELDIGVIEDAIQAKDWRGARSYSPRMMLGLLMYAYCNGIYSSRKIEKATYESIPLRVIAGDQHPHFTVINRFRLDHHRAFKELFLVVLRICQMEGMVELGHVALDGSKVKANASKHKAMSYKRMRKQVEKLKEEITELVARAEKADAEEDDLYGSEKRQPEIPEELKRRKKRLERIREAQAVLEREAAEGRAADLKAKASRQREKEADDTVDPVERKRAGTRAKNMEEKAEKLREKFSDFDDPPSGQSSDGSGLPEHQTPFDKHGKPTEKAQRNFTDPDSRIMVRDGGYLQAYNCQIVVDDEHQIIVAEAVTNQAPDQEHLVPLMNQVPKNVGVHPMVFTADAGYFSKDNIEFCESKGIDTYVAVEREKHGKTKDKTPASPEESMAKSYMKEKLKTPRGKDIYAKRKAIVEPVFGHIKSARGFGNFSLRGLEKVASEWSFIALCHNLLKLYKNRSDPALIEPQYIPIRRKNTAFHWLRKLSSLFASFSPPNLQCTKPLCATPS